MYHSLNLAQYTFLQARDMCLKRASGTVWVEVCTDKIRLSYDHPVYTSKELSQHTLDKLMPYLRKVENNRYVNK